MCLMAPVRIVEVHDGMAVVDAGGVRRSATNLLVPEARPGDWALMTSGTLVRLVEPSLVAELAAALRTATGEDS